MQVPHHFFLQNICLYDLDPTKPHTENTPNQLPKRLGSHMIYRLISILITLPLNVFIKSLAYLFAMAELLDMKDGVKNSHTDGEVRSHSKRLVMCDVESLLHMQSIHI